MNSQDNTWLDTEKNICNGFGCHREPTNSIEQEIDGIGMIALELCDNCVAKFREQ